MPKIIEPTPVAVSSILLGFTLLAEPMTLVGREFNTRLANGTRTTSTQSMHPLYNYTLLAPHLKDLPASLRLTTLADARVFYTLPSLASNLAGFLLQVNSVVNAILSGPFRCGVFAFNQSKVAFTHFPFGWMACCMGPLLFLVQAAATRHWLDSETLQEFLVTKGYAS